MVRQWRRSLLSAGSEVQRLPVTITGTGLNGATSVTAPPPTGGGPNGLTISAPVVNAAGTQLTVNITISGTAGLSYEERSGQHPGRHHTRQRSCDIYGNTVTEATVGPGNPNLDARPRKSKENVGWDNKLGKCGDSGEHLVSSKEIRWKKKALPEQAAYISILNAEGLGEVPG